MRATSFLLPLLLIAAALAAIFLGRLAPGRHDAEVVATAPTEDAAAVAEARRTRGRHGPPAPLVAVAENASAASAEAAGSARSAGTHPVVVVLGRDGEPRAGVRLELRPGLAEGELHLSGPAVAAPAGRPIAVLTTDAMGRAELRDLTVGRWDVRALAAEGRGCAALVVPAPGAARRASAVSPPIMIVLVPERDLAISVTEQGGRPVSRACVMIATDDVVGAAVGWTDADGRVLFRARADELGGWASARRMHVQVLRFGAEHPRAVFEIEAGDCEVAMTVPPMATVAFRLEAEGDGTPALLTFAASGTDLGGEAGGSLMRGRVFPMATGVHALEGAGRSFRLTATGAPPISTFAPGGACEVLVERPGHLDRASHLVLPRRASHVAMLTAGAARARVRLRILDEAGRPFVPDRLLVRRDGTATPIVQTPGVEVGSGAVAIELDPGVAVTLAVADRNGLHDRGQRGAGDGDATIAIPALAPASRLDLGDVRLRLPPVLVAGRVVGPDAAGVAGACLVIARGTAASDAASESRPEPSEHHFGKTDADGHFVIRGFGDLESTYGIVCAGTWRSFERAFRPGETDVVLTAWEPGTIAGRLRAADPDLGVGPELELISAATGSSHRPSLGVDGNFEATGLDPGFQAIRVTYAGFDVGTIDDVEVISGATLRPAALEDLVVGSDFFRATVCVVGADGEPEVDATIELVVADDARRQRLLERAGRHGAAFVLPRGPRVTVHVRLPDDDQAPITFVDPSFPLVVRLDGR